MAPPDWTKIGVSRATYARLVALRDRIAARAERGLNVMLQPTEPANRSGRPTISLEALILAFLDRWEAKQDRAAASNRRRRAKARRRPAKAPLPE